MTEKEQARLLARIALQKLADIEKGHSLRLLLWPDGSTGIVMGAGYAGEQDGDDPLIILRREDYEDEIDPDNPEDIDIMEEKIAEALSKEITKKKEKILGEYVEKILDEYDWNDAMRELEDGDYDTPKL